MRYIVKCKRCSNTDLKLSERDRSLGDVFECKECGYYMTPKELRFLEENIKDETKVCNCKNE